MSQTVHISNHNISSVSRYPLIDEIDTQSEEAMGVLNAPLDLSIESGASKEQDEHTFSSITYEGHFYYLAHPIRCQLKKMGDSWMIEYEPFDLKAWGKNQYEAIEAFKFAFHSLFQNFALENEANLSNESIELKGRLLELVSFYV